MTDPQSPSDDTAVLGVSRSAVPAGTIIAVQPHHQSAQRHARGDMIGRAQILNAKILLVDDDEDGVHLVQQLLQHEGYT